MAPTRGTVSPRRRDRTGKPMRKALIMLGMLSDSDTDWLAAIAERRTLPAGTRIIEEGKPIASLFIVLDGTARVSVQQTDVARVTGGELLGEVSMIDQRPPAASVTADTDTTVLAVDRALLEQRLRDDTGFGCRFYHAVAVCLADRLRSSVARLGHGGAPPPEDLANDDELDPRTRDTARLAAARFDALRKGVPRA